MQLNVLTYYSDEPRKSGLGQTDSIGLTGTAHDLSECPLTNEQWKLVLWGMFTIEFLSWDDEAKVHQKCTAAHVIICNAASGLVFRKWLCGCGNR